MKKKVLIIFCILSSVLCYSQTKTEVFYEYNLEKAQPFYLRIKEHFDNLWCGYFKADFEYEQFGEKKFVVEKINIYTKKGNSFVFLGSFGTDGIYDKDNRLIIAVPEIAPNIKILGYSSSILDYPLSTTFVKERNGKISEMEEWANVWIDFENLTLKEQDSFYEK